MAKTKVLVVDDETNIRDLLSTSLRFAGFDVQTAANGAQALSLVQELEPDIILLDVMLPDMNGFSITKKLRSSQVQIPILFLTARDETEDKITGLTVGGDDYLTKPFSLDEVVARIQAILRRTKAIDAEPSMIDAGAIQINQDAHEVLVEGKPVDLSPTEYKLLRFLVINADRVLTKAQILDHVWQYDFRGDAGIVETYISYLRKKIDIYEPPLIHTVRGVGYRLRMPAAK